ncbi:MAG: MmpS family transport accessory protein [Pseudonocardiaceae bacterium]
MPPRPDGHSSRRRWPWIAGVLSGIALIAVAGALVANTRGGDPGTVSGASPAGPLNDSGERAAGGSVVYEVTGTGTAAGIDFSSPDTSGESQLVNVPLPFRVSVPWAGVPSVYTVVARSGPDGGSISCSILSDGDRLDEHSADGPSGSVACSGAP